MIGFMLAFIIFPMVSADIIMIMPGYHGISINNYISNMNDFPDYVFVSGGNENWGFGTSMCPIKEIGGDGLIESYYKFCSISVYALEKSQIATEILENIQDETFMYSMNHTEAENYLQEFLISSNAKEVISDIRTYKEVPVASIQTDINNYYEIDLSQVKMVPDTEEIEKSNLVYLYIVVSLVSLITIILILIKRRRIEK